MAAARQEQQGVLLAVCTSTAKGMCKTDRGSGRLVVGYGLAGDAHGGTGQRQVSLLAQESIDRLRVPGFDPGPGDFAENLTTRGLDLWALPVGTRLRVGETAELEVTRIGKDCHARCAIFHRVGDCVMPREGVFAVVRVSGAVTHGDPIHVSLPGEDEGRAAS